MTFSCAEKGVQIMGPALRKAYVFWLNSHFFQSFLGCWRFAALRPRNNALFSLAEDWYFLAMANGV